MIEYILMVVISIILISGLALAVFTPLSDFLARLNNAYIKCLLETGELPKVSSEGEGLCDAERPSFQARNMDGSPSSNNPNGDGKSSENNKGESSNGEGSSSSNAAGGSDSAGGSAAGRTRKSSLIRNGMRSNGNASPELNGSGKTTTVPVDDFQAGEGFMATNNSGGPMVRSRKKTKKIDLSGLTEYDRKKAEREQEKIRTVAVDSESFTQKQNKKLTVKPPPPKEQQEDLNVATDFASYFKIFFFIVIILFIIILMGSQAMQMTNNSD